MKNKIFGIIVLVIGILATITGVIFALKYDAAEPEKSAFYQNITMYTTYFLFFIAALIAIGFALFQLIGNFKQAKVGLFAAAALAALFVITYMMSGPSNSIVEQKFAITPHMAKVIGSGLLSTYILVGITILSIMWTGIANKFKN
jgi:hypothetical protein